MTLNREKGQCPCDAWRRERLMKRILILWLCILCCLFPLCACSQPEKRIEDQMNLALEQLDRPMGEAFEALDLPGSLEEAAKPQYCLLVENGAEVLGKQMNVVIMPDSRGNGKELYQRPASLVEYSALLKEDYAYPVKLYEALRKVYGDEEQEAGAQPFGKADEQALKSMGGEERYAALWKKDGSEIVLSVSGSGEDIRASVELRIPPIRPVFMPDGTRIR